MVLLPEGKIINDPDTVKLIKVLPTTLNDETFFVVVIKLDDDSELMLDKCATRMEAEALADRCCRLLNGEELDSVDIPSFVEPDGQEDGEESSDWDLSAEDEESDVSVAKTPPPIEESSDWNFSESEEGDNEPSPKESPVEEESSDWGFSSEEEQKPVKPIPTEEESSDWGFSSEEEPVEPKPVVEEESSDWGFSSEEEQKPVKPIPTEEESSDWGFSSEEEVSPPKKTSKPKIQKPYVEPKVESTSDKKTKKTPKATVKSKDAKPKATEVVQKQVITEPVQAKPVPRVTGFIEDDSDEWIPDNGLDDWYD